MAWNLSIGKSKIPDTIKKFIVWEVTPLGNHKLEMYEGEATPKFNVLSSLKELGPSNLEEVAQRAGIGKDSVHFQLKQVLAPYS